LNIKISVTFWTTFEHAGSKRSLNYRGLSNDALVHYT